MCFRKGKCCSKAQRPFPLVAFDYNTLYRAATASQLVQRVGGGTVSWKPFSRPSAASRARWPSVPSSLYARACWLPKRQMSETEGKYGPWVLPHLPEVSECLRKGMGYLGWRLSIALAVTSSWDQNVDDTVSIGITHLFRLNPSFRVTTIPDSWLLFLTPLGYNEDCP